MYEVYLKFYEYGEETSYSWVFNNHEDAERLVQVIKCKGYSDNGPSDYYRTGIIEIIPTMLTFGEIINSLPNC